MRRVVITGIGIITSIGNSAGEVEADGEVIYLVKDMKVALSGA